MEASRLNELYRTYAPLVHARARRIVGDDADDVVQDVFLKLVRHEPPAGAELKWMYLTATNSCLDRLRSTNRHGDSWQEQVRNAIERRAPIALEQMFESVDLCRRLLAAADTKTKRIAVLVYVDQMTQEEAANMLGISRKTVAERLSKFATQSQGLLRSFQP